MKDTQGREYAKICDLHAGDLIETDAGFDCIDPNSLLFVEYDGKELYIECLHGKHKLAGQIADEDGVSLIGIYPIK